MGKNKKNKVHKKYKVGETRQERLSALRASKKNLEEIEKPRKAIKSSFIANHDGDECPKCFIKIEKGQRVRFDSDGFLIHVRHEIKEPAYEICSSCFLTRPCMCDEA